MFVRVYSWYAEIVWAEQLLRNLHDRLKLDVAEEDFCTFGLEFDAAFGERNLVALHVLPETTQHDRDLAVDDVHAAISNGIEVERVPLSGWLLKIATGHEAPASKGLLLCAFLKLHSWAVGAIAFAPIFERRIFSR